jgi:hypothetical protein
MRKALIALGMLVCSLGTPALAQLSISFGSPGVSIGINLPVYPTLQRIPGYPVYYSTAVNSNYFFYDGLYWVFEGDDWYASDWYNGPWYRVDRYDVPLFILRIPVRYYRHAPDYFRSWRADAPPRWGERWGGTWEQRRSGWDRWNRKSAPAAAPLPTYQRQYSGERYPEPVQQVTIQTQNYRYQPKDPVARQYYEQRRSQVQAVAPQPRVAPEPRQPTAPRQQVAPRQEAAPRPQAAPRQEAAPRPQVTPRQQAAPPQQAAPREQAPRQQAAPRQETAPAQAPAARPQAPGAKGQERAAEAREQAKGQERAAEAREQAKGQERAAEAREQAKGQDKDKDKDPGKGKGGPKGKD